ncbi:Hypothetical protein, putative [Bodo saltans]|uniref:Uncharacterized protein n=1 Tax=Bodo saltans TaxID=75058 RepID=A0A0S4JGK9_BODSA|nr:Hypothetical protein, putative [Bodo saltans]|eukprot:CUG89272.1 Hypothetical protein, putative [Bodo saltans]
MGERKKDFTATDAQEEVFAAICSKAHRAVTKLRCSNTRMPEMFLFLRSLPDSWMTN